MTCIVGMVDESGVYLAGDAAATDAVSIELRRDPKVFERKVGKATMLIGFCDSFRIGQLLRHDLVLPTRRSNVPVDRWMCTSFVRSVRACLSRNGVERSDSELGDLTILVGFEGRLFRIDNDYSVSERTASFDAIGSGSVAALGALMAQERMLKHLKKKYPTRSRVLDALSISEQITPTVRSPFTILHLPH
jgi:20S proteasome alpha/beta subunit